MESGEKMIDTWYDRHTRDYVIQIKDEDGNQIGEAERVGNKEERDYLIKMIKQETEGMNADNYITLKEWAEKNGITPDTARQRANRGAFQTAKKIGNLWIIDKNEAHIDHRRKEGR